MARRVAGAAVAGLILQPAIGADAAAQAPRARYFYKGLGYGSDAYMGPLAVFLNKGFALSVTETANRKIFVRYGFESVGDALRHPGTAIERNGGWWNFVRQELLPLSHKPKDMKWFTNYMGHLLEGGSYYRRLTEWYEAHGAPVPALLAGATTLSAALLNELYEARYDYRGYAGTVADLYFFDWAGVALFSFEAVPRFLTERLHAGLWTGQASVVLPAAEIENNATRLYFKIPWKVIPRSSLFLWTGIGAQAGLTFHRPRGVDISVGFGPDTEKRRVDPVTGNESVTFDFSGGVYVDRNGSLLGSVHVTQVPHRFIALNVYPGVIADGFGAWLIVDRRGGVSFGLTHRWVGTGLGVGLHP